VSAPLILGLRRGKRSERDREGSVPKALRELKDERRKIEDIKSLQEAKISKEKSRSFEQGQEKMRGSRRRTLSPKLPAVGWSTPKGGEKKEHSRHEIRQERT